MRLLFEMDKKDYENCTHSFVRNSARSIIISNKKLAMIHSMKYDYYKFPGGGIENGENPIDAMIRETREEAGLVVKPETAKEYGYVHRVQRSGKDATECFKHHNRKKDQNAYDFNDYMSYGNTPCIALCTDT